MNKSLDIMRHNFEVILEGAQVCLNWEKVLKKRENYRKNFRNFNPEKIAIMTVNELENLHHDDGIIRNRLKIKSNNYN